MKMFVILDKKAGAYNQPFFFPNKGLALRAFGELVADEKTSVAKYPNDFSIWYIGDFNDKMGVVDALPKPEFVDEAVNMIKK